MVALPAEFTTRQAMAIGTAGYTASLCVEALIKQGVKPEQGEGLVTAANGGVGSVAIALLEKAGFKVVAATGKAGEADYLKHGGTSVIDCAELSERGKPLQKERWAGVVDAAGSQTLVNACAQTRYGAVAACGLAQGYDFPATVMPFILRGVSLLGIDSVMAPMASRMVAWTRLARDLEVNLLELIVKDINLSDALGVATQMMKGTLRGRVVVDVDK
jgi:acrylyl-CoA reductase (NADPH)